MQGSWQAHNSDVLIARARRSAPPRGDAVIYRHPLIVFAIEEKDRATDLREYGLWVEVHILPGTWLRQRSWDVDQRKPGARGVTIDRRLRCTSLLPAA